MNDPREKQRVKAEAIRAAIGLIRAARAASLATVDDSQPFASLVTPAAAPDRSLLLLLSGLSPHTRHLRTNPRCSLMLMGAPTSDNPQSAPRISLSGAAAPEPDPVLKARWVALHPYAAFYAGLGDFQLWRFRAETGQFVGGFASAHRMQPAELDPNLDAVAAIVAAEAGIIAHCNGDHADAMDRIAHQAGGAGEGWRMMACDIDGCDLGRGDTVLRVPWSEPVQTPGDVRTQLVQLARGGGVAPASRMQQLLDPGAGGP